MEEAHTFLSRPPNFVSLQKLQEQRFKEEREEEKENERQKRLLEEEEDRRKLDEQQQREGEGEGRIRTSSSKKKHFKQLTNRGEASSKSQEQSPQGQDDVGESINGSEKSKEKSRSQRKEKWSKRKMEKKRVESARVVEAGDEIQNAVENAVEATDGDENWVWRKKSEQRNNVNVEEMVRKIQAVTVISENDVIKKEKKRNERRTNRGFEGSRHARKMKMAGTSRGDENLVWVKKEEQATSNEIGR